MRRAAPRHRVEAIAEVVAPPPVVAGPKQRAPAERLRLGDASPVLEDEGVAVQRRVTTDGALGGSQQDGITTVTTLPTRHGNPPPGGNGLGYVYLSCRPLLEPAPPDRRAVDGS